MATVTPLVPRRAREIRPPVGGAFAPKAIEQPDPIAVQMRCSQCEKHKIEVTEMSYYFLAVVDVHDWQTFEKYQEETIPIVLPLGVTIHAVTNDAKSVEGEFDGTTVILLEFADEDTFKKWWDSEEYGEVKKLRLASADTKLAIAFERTSLPDAASV
jgi:uncharacterized protein (DUF1330 family)